MLIEYGIAETQNYSIEKLGIVYKNGNVLCQDDSEINNVKEVV